MKLREFVIVFITGGTIAAGAYSFGLFWGEREIKKTHIPIPRLYFDVEANAWHTDGSWKMVERAVEAARSGDSVTIRDGQFFWTKNGYITFTGAMAKEAVIEPMLSGEWITKKKP